ncbi:hypothetical protein ACVR0C_05790 [Streptococcus downii]|jgi:hypothetical protein|uniref:Uncharacterized protein n=1 Tax=Streptococcus downii TaxID=1968889 RepID=A0ABW0Y6J1_9STRE|nr:hypothetical protein [Streptococcus downii]
MKKLIKKFLFLFVVIGVIVNVISITGNDDMNIILIGLNPLLNLLESNSMIRELIKGFGFYIWNILSMLSFIVYEFLLDVILNKKDK